MSHRAVAGLLLLAVTGCASVSAGRITTDRMDYGEVIAESWKRQTLLNVVRMRYADAPVFLDVTSVINSYTLSARASASATLPSRTDPNVFGLGTDVHWSNTPTVTYQPLLGDRFTRSMLQPVSPVAVFQLLQGGWSADIVLRTVVSSINGLRNSTSGVAADTGFDQLVEAFGRVQRARGLAIRIVPTKEGTATVIVLRQAGTDSATREDGRRIRELLGVAADLSEVELTYGLFPGKPGEVAVLSRSMLDLMLQLGFGVELPAGDLTEGRVLPGRRPPGEAQPHTLVRIRSGNSAPADAYVAVPYKDHWYWIEDTDIASKRNFTFVLILFSLAETGQSLAAPVVTVPSR